MAFNPVPIKLPPGMFRNGTNYEAAGRWYDGSQIRWQNGRMKPVGGWQSMMLSGATLGGAPRGGIVAQDNAGDKYFFFGTASALWVGTGGNFDNITPTGYAAGRSDSIFSLGYGAGPYGQGNYGQPASGSNLQVQATTWSFDNYGQDVVCCSTSDNKIYAFDPTVGTATQIANSPTAISVFVTNEDYIMALGSASIGRQVQWPDIDVITNWTAGITNSAGALPLNTGGICMSGTRVGTQNIVWTTADVHVLNFIGSPGIYGAQRLAEGCGLVGPNAYAVTDVAYWWSWGGFMRYNGVVQPIECEVQDYIWRVVDWTQTAKIYGEVNSEFNEVTWHFPAKYNGTLLVPPPAENDSYVTYNFKENIWYFGIRTSLGNRTCWIDKGVWNYPVAADANGVVYEHETTDYLNNGATRVGEIYATSGPVEIGGGKKINYVDLAIPDIEATGSASVAVTIRSQFAPDGPVTTLGPAPVVTNAEGYFPMQFAGRQASFEYASATDGDWSAGTFRVNVKQSGSR